MFQKLFEFLLMPRCLVLLLLASAVPILAAPVLELPRNTANTDNQYSVLMKRVSFEDSQCTLRQTLQVVEGLQEAARMAEYAAHKVLRDRSDVSVLHLHQASPQWN
jgi:hypothetical protein